MSKELIYLTYSLFCIDQIRKYISNDSNTRAEKFTKELMFKIENLAEFPNLGIYLRDNQYKYVISKNYLVYYFILNSKVYILSVKHVKNI